MWDWRCRRDGEPLWRAAGGAQAAIPVYTTEGGWLHLGIDALVRQTLEAQQAGFKGAKLKVGKPLLAEDIERLRAVRQAVGDSFELMVDANQCFALGEALRRAPRYAELGIGWFEEPLPADDLQGHAQLAAQGALPIAVGESLYSIGQFADYVRAQACHIVQVDVARVGGITPWLKVAHLAEACNLAVAPHFQLVISAATFAPPLSSASTALKRGFSQLRSHSNATISTLTRVAPASCRRCIARALFSALRRLGVLQTLQRL